MLLDVLVARKSPARCACRDRAPGQLRPECGPGEKSYLQIMCRRGGAPAPLGNGD